MGFILISCEGRLPVPHGVASHSIASPHIAHKGLTNRSSLRGEGQPLFFFKNSDNKYVILKEYVQKNRWN
jgi:hypothetical protein